MLDMVTDPEHFLKVCQHVVASVAQSYGMSYSDFTFQNVASSGKEWMMRREKLTELREESRQRAQVHESEVADLLGFPGEKLRPDFHEQAIPTDPIEEMDLFERRMNRGIDDPIQYLMRKNTDWTYDEAKAHLEKSVSVAMWFFSLLRAANLSMTATPANPGQPAEQNGADGGAASPVTKPKRDLSWVREEMRRAA